jgi:hypothetical protein
MENREFGAEDV